MVARRLVQFDLNCNSCPRRARSQRAVHFDVVDTLIALPPVGVAWRDGWSKASELQKEQRGRRRIPGSRGDDKKRELCRRKANPECCLRARVAYDGGELVNRKYHRAKRGPLHRRQLARASSTPDSLCVCKVPASCRIHANLEFATAPCAFFATPPLRFIHHATRRPPAGAQSRYRRRRNAPHAGCVRGEGMNCNLNRTAPTAAPPCARPN